MELSSERMMPAGARTRSSLPRCLLLLCVVFVGAAKADEVPISVEAEWGTRRLALNCLPPHAAREFDPQTWAVHWNKKVMDDKEELLTMFRGNVNSSSSSYRLNADMSSLVLGRVDLSSAGVYTCNYSPLTASRPPNEMAVNLTVTAAPSKIEECDSDTRNQSEPCRIAIPESAQKMNITCSKMGSNYPVRFRLELELHTYMTSDFGRQEFPESDGSTSIVHRFEVGVDLMKSPGKFNCVLMDEKERSVEEVSIILYQDDKKPIPEERMHEDPVASASVTVVAVCVTLAIVVLIGLVITTVRCVLKRRRAHAQDPVGV